MMLTFGQYNILTVAAHTVTRTQLVEQTSFDYTLVSYLIKGLLYNGLLRANDKEDEDQPHYELTDIGLACIAEYEQANPDLVINRLMSHK